MWLDYRIATHDVAPLEFDELQILTEDGSIPAEEAAREVGEQLEQEGYDREIIVNTPEGDIKDSPIGYEVSARGPDHEEVTELFNQAFIEGTDRIPKMPRGVGGYAEDPEEMIDTLENGALYVRIIGYSDHDNAMPINAKRDMWFTTNLVNRQDNLDALNTVHDAIQESPYELVGYGATGGTDRLAEPEHAFNKLRAGESQLYLYAEVETPVEKPVVVGYLGGNERTDFGVGTVGSMAGPYEVNWTDEHDRVFEDLTTALASQGLTLEHTYNLA